jgi:Leucine-rich repeat (LRR) protein
MGFRRVTSAGREWSAPMRLFIGSASEGFHLTDTTPRKMKQIRRTYSLWGAQSPIFLGMMLCGFVLGVSAQVVTIPDPRLQQRLRSVLGKPTGNITASDMASITRLDASEAGIRSLQGLETATNLVWLDLTDNRLTNLLALADLKELNWLSITYNYLTNLSFPRGLNQLRTLRLSWNSFTNLNLSI